MDNIYKKQVSISEQNKMTGNEFKIHSSILIKVLQKKKKKGEEWERWILGGSNTM